MAVALKLATHRLLGERRRQPPLLLLDEIFAELDAARRDRLSGLLDGEAQTFLTTAISPPTGMLDSARRFRLSGGNLEEIV